MLFHIKLLIILFSINALKDHLLIYLKQQIDIGNPHIYDKEDNINFSYYSTTIKPIAIYYSNSDLKKSNLNIYDSKMKIYSIKVKQLEEQINLAKSHGIYGFAFFYFLFNDKNNSYENLNIILQNKYLKIHFLIIFENNGITINGKDFNISKLFIDIMKYILDERYIKFNNKYIIGINNSDFNNIILMRLREKFKENKLGEIFIFSRTNDYKRTKNNIMYNGFLYSPSYNSLEKIKFQYNKTIGYFYIHLLYHNLLFHPLIKSNFFRMSISMKKYPIIINGGKTYIYWDYSPDKFYFLNKVIIKWTKENYGKNEQYVFIDNFNFLLKDSILGYANINSFSKALYELPFISDNNSNFNLNKLSQNITIMLQVHVHYIDLLKEVINKTNNMPVPFDLYITTNTKEKKACIENYLKLYSKANKFEILITPNKGRDIIPCLIQLKSIWMNYKYFCHIHTKKHEFNEDLGKFWQQYLYENLLGNKNIIKKILTDFENHDRLGFIFPENYHSIIKNSYFYKYKIYYHLNRIFEILFPNKKFRAGNIMNFPAGNMFWARISAIYQIFNEKLINLAPREYGQKDDTLLHAIERFWLFLVKLNGFSYKTYIYNI